MTRYTSSISPKGQITIPIEIREAFGLDPKDKVVIEVIDEIITVKPAMSVVDALHRSIKPVTPGLTWSQLETMAREDAATKTYWEGLHPDDPGHE